MKEVQTKHQQRENVQHTYRWHVVVKKTCGSDTLSIKGVLPVVGYPSLAL